MRITTGCRYLGVAAAIGAVGAVFAWLAWPHPVYVTFFGVWVLGLPFVVFVYLGVLELVVGERAERGPGRGEPVVAAELEGDTPDRLAA